MNFLVPLPLVILTEAISVGPMLSLGASGIDVVSLFVFSPLLDFETDDSA